MDAGDAGRDEFAEQTCPFGEVGEGEAGWFAVAVHGFYALVQTERDETGGSSEDGVMCGHRSSPVERVAGLLGSVRASMSVLTSMTKPR